ncbi:MAG: DUF4154 domain-containing protein [Planctomycetaceae bacterium]|nr:DUF4154 domain-containing protein [Planctomycetaceae bacterium]
MKLIRPLLVLLIFTQLLVLGVGESRAQQRPRQQPIGPIEYELKAVWLYHFGNSMFQWEERANDPFVIAVFGDFPSDLKEQLEKVERLRIRGRRIIIKQSNDIEQLKQTQPNILFVTRGNDFSERVDDAKDEFENKPVLIVGDFDFEKDRIPISFSVDPNTRRLKLHRNITNAVVPEGISFRNEEQIWDRLTNLETIGDEDRTSSIAP